MLVVAVLIAGGPYTANQDCEKLTGIFIWLAII
jgi:hypothetical protein